MYDGVYSCVVYSLLVCCGPVVSSEKLRPRGYDIFHQTRHDLYVKLSLCLCVYKKFASEFKNAIPVFIGHDNMLFNIVFVCSVLCIINIIILFYSRVALSFSWKIIPKQKRSALRHGILSFSLREDLL